MASGSTGVTIETLTQLCNDFLALLEEDDGEMRVEIPGFLHTYRVEVLLYAEGDAVTELALLQFLTARLGHEPTPDELQAYFDDLTRCKANLEHRLEGGGHITGGPKEANPQGDQVRKWSLRM